MKVYKLAGCASSHNVRLREMLQITTHTYTYPFKVVDRLVTSTSHAV